MTDLFFLEKLFAKKHIVKVRHFSLAKMFSLYAAIVKQNGFVSMNLQTHFEIVELGNFGIEE